MRKKTLIIAATSARAYTQAAVACGYEVVVLDVFADADTTAIAKQAFRLRMHDWQLDVENFKDTFSGISLDEIDGFLYGSLFDGAPELLDWISVRVPLIGNVSGVMQAAKSFDFFKLLDDLQIAHPEVKLKMPRDPENWLCKSIGGNGGMHVRLASQGGLADYFQLKLTGTPVSMLFVADTQKVHKIGFNRQFVSPTDVLPYRYAGAVSGVDLPMQVQEIFSNVAQKLTAVLGLRGVCSLDAILDGDTLWILELNPRLSASFELYPNLFKAHLQSCEGKLFELPQAKSSCAKMIVYAEKAVEIASEFDWPYWANDKPMAYLVTGEIKIEKNAPICSVIAEAPSAAEAERIVKQRAIDCINRLN